MPQDTFRLTEMQVEEVAFVDRPANKRKFLIVKREKGTEDMPQGAAVHKGPGGLSAQPATETETAAKADPPVPPAAAPAAPAAEATPPEPGNAGPGVSLTAPMQKVMSDALGAVIETAGELKKAIDGATIVEKEDEVKANEVIKALSEAADVLTDLATASLRPLEASESTPEMAKRHEVIRAKRVVRESELETKNASLVEKVGAKLSAHRRAQLEQAISILGDLHTGVVPQESSEEEVGKLKKENASLQDALRKSRSTVEKARGERLDSAAIPVDKDDQKVEKKSAVIWGLDMNADKTESF